MNLELIRNCVEGNTEEVKRLVDEGADVNVQNTDEGYITSPLLSATGGNHLDVIKLLVDKGAKIEYEDLSALMMACVYGNVHTVKFFIERGANVNFKDKNNKTPLFYATILPYSRMKIIRELLYHGADQYVKDESDRTPLDYTGEFRETIEDYITEIRGKNIKPVK